MSVRRKLSPPVSEPARFDEGRLPDGRILRAGREVSIRGATGRFRVRWFDAHGAVTCWSLSKQQMRTFPLDRVKTVHHKTTPERPR